MVADALIVTPSDLENVTLNVPGDKSLSHRALIISALAEGTTSIHGLLRSEDVEKTRAALQSLGVSINCDQPVSSDTCDFVEGCGLKGLRAADRDINCGNSGTTMRLLAGILAGQIFNSRLTGDVSLQRRPMLRIAEPLRKMGAKIQLSSNNTAPIEFIGMPGLQTIDYKMPVPSAQVKSAILMAGLYAEGWTRISEPAPCRDHTERMLEACGVQIERAGNAVNMKSPGKLQSLGTVDIPGDLSSAANFLVLAVLSGTKITLPRVGINPTRDGVIRILRRMGAQLDVDKRRQTQGGEPVADLVASGGQLRGVEISSEDVALAIDEIPILMVAAACASGETVLRGADELRLKESDRLFTMANGLRVLGVDVQDTKNGLVVRGGRIQGGNVDGHGDHRVAMAFVVAGLIADGPVQVRNCRNISTSYPSFVRDLRTLGAGIEEGGL